MMKSKVYVIQNLDLSSMKNKELTKNDNLYLVKGVIIYISNDKNDLIA